jgi:hypothetical protein
MEKLKSFWRSHQVKIIVAIGFGIFFALLFSKLNRNTFVSNDDTTFPEFVSQFTTVWDYLYNRLSTWSSRVLPEIFTYIFSSRSVNYWRLTSLIIYGLSVFLGYKLYKVSSPKPNDKKDGVVLAVIMGGLLLMGLNVLDNYGAVYWFTGAMNYFWLTPFFLASLYAPLYILLNNKLPSKVWLAVSLIASVLTVISHEQFSLALAAILVVAAIYHAIKNKKFNNSQAWLSGLALVAIAGFLFELLAPSNAIRLEANVAFWLPDMYNVPFLVRLESDIRWFMDALINQTGYLLPIIWTLLAVLLLKNPKKKPIDSAVATVLAASAIFGLFADKVMVITAFWREFYPVWGFVGNAKDWLPIVAYVFILLLTLIAMWRVVSKDKTKAIMPIVLSVLAAGTIGTMCLSPTMYASAHRPLYVGSVLLVMVIVILLARVLSSSKSRH